jgi:hypothetical protein
MLQKILGLCSREIDHESMRTSLLRSLARFKAKHGRWDYLVCTAEQQGIAPLLYKHLKNIEFVIPDDDARRLLQSLFLRNRRAADIRLAAIGEVLTALQGAAIEVLLVKGIALCNFAYSEPAYRPMRDIDLLVKKDDLVRAEQVLFDLGYQAGHDHDIPEDYYHLPPLSKIIGGLPVTLELHHNLLPFHRHYPLWPLEKSYPTAMTITVNERKARTLSLEQTLHYVFLHGFRAPLTYEPFRLVHIADIVNLVESHCDCIDWQKIRLEQPLLLTSISRFHAVTPWQEFVISTLKLPVDDHYSDRPSAYHGWPRQQLRSTKTTQLLDLARQTLLPSRWWLQVYYGHLGGLRLLKARLFDHPIQLLHWIRAYWHAYAHKKR